MSLTLNILLFNKRVLAIVGLSKKVFQIKEVNISSLEMDTSSFLQGEESQGDMIQEGEE